jgi:O-acetyl-ADP-ribose deacetylase (regulator of RNase III)
MSNVRVLEGDLLKSRMHALVNTVNTVGIMGKGVALAFKKRYPAMYLDYVRRCDRHEVKIGEPYPFEVSDHLVINFPTKEHWRSVSRINDIVAGLEHLERHYKGWGVRSLAVPPLGCGNGQLEWRVVGPVLLRHLRRLDIPVELYAPHGSSLLDEAQLDLLGDEYGQDQLEWRLAPWLVAVAEIVHRLESQRYHWPVGRVMLQKIVYFADAAGLPTDLQFVRSSFGPFAPDLKNAVGRMQNNGLIIERQRGRMFEVLSGPALDDARLGYGEQLDQWSDLIDRIVDLAARFDNKGAEVAATVHYTAGELYERLGRVPTIDEVIRSVEEWKSRRQPHIDRDDILRAIVNLGTQGWLLVAPDSATAKAVDDMVVAGSLPRAPAKSLTLHDRP